MASIDKAAIGFTIAIVAIGVGFALYGDTAQNAGIGLPLQVAPTTEPVMEEPETQTDLPKEMTGVEESEPVKPLKVGWERATSEQDPGLGHESHQLIVLLPPSDNVYSGTLSYDASEPIQLVTLHGPLAEGDDAGQPIWTPDGETKFALTLVDLKNAQGEWKFAGNALGVHTMNTEQFSVDYKIDYTEKAMSDTVMTGTATSIQDPGLGHESHKITILLGPSSDMYTGIVSYTASENIQLVSLRGPVGDDERPTATWTPDGETIFELTFIDPNNAMGSWEFEGNAVGIHTMFPSPFTVSYSVSATAVAAVEMEETQEEPMEETQESAGPQTYTVDMPVGTSVPGCETINKCYIPASIVIHVGDTVEWINSDTVAHTVTSGTPSDGPSGEFDSSLILAHSSYEFTFEESGSYDYFCLVHPWMSGDVQVN